jgi:hypothetical protein
LWKSGALAPRKSLKSNRASAPAKNHMPLWSLDDWQYVERETVTNPKGQRWTVALMDVLGQQGDPDIPDRLMEIQYSSGRFFTLVYSENGGLQRERGYSSLEEATNAYQNLLVGVIDGSIDPSQPVFRENLED